MPLDSTRRHSISLAARISRSWRPTACSSAATRRPPRQPQSDLDDNNATVDGVDRSDSDLRAPMAATSEPKDPLQGTGDWGPGASGGARGVISH
eukprot:3394967-Pyramimonas_sp.AAC.1